MGKTTMIDPHFQKVFSLALGIKDPWYIKCLDMVPSAKNPEILEMRVEVDFLEGSKFSYNAMRNCTLSMTPGREYEGTLTSSSTGHKAPEIELDETEASGRGI